MKDLISRFGQTHKIRSMSVDTNVISDVIPYVQYSNRRKPLSKEESKLYFERCKQSVHSLAIGLSFKVNLFGTPTVRRELRRRPGLIELYNRFFYGGTLQIDKNTRNLAKMYCDEVNLDIADAFILATISLNRVDLFLSWNRQDIVNINNVQKVSLINRKKRIPLPVLATPKEFLERVFLTDKQTIGITDRPIPEGLRLQSFPSR